MIIHVLLWSFASFCLGFFVGVKILKRQIKKTLPTEFDKILQQRKQTNLDKQH